MKDKKLWFEYCKALNINPYTNHNEDILKGFETWQRMRREFSYFDYMQNNT